MKRLISFYLMLLIVIISSAVSVAGTPDTLSLCGQVYVDSLEALGQLTPRPTDLPLIFDTTHIRIHYTNSGKDSTTLAYVRSVARAAEASWVIEITQLGWKTPLSDGTLGGDSLVDIYIRDTSGYAYQGLTFTDQVTPKASSSWIQLVKWLPSNDSIQFAVAHEFNHVCQNSYNHKGDGWFKENTAMWITQYVFPNTRHVLNGWINQPTNGITPLGGTNLKITTAVNNYPYGGALWCNFLDEWKDSLVMLRVWEMTSRTATPMILQHIDTVLSNYYFSNLEEALKEYAIWRGFTGH